MKKRTRRMTLIKTIALLLAICMIIPLLPIEAIAATSAADLTADETEQTAQTEETAKTDEEIIASLLEPIIVEEDVTKRRESEKHFLCDDGSYIAISYSEAVHEEVNGEWVDIEYDVTDDGSDISPIDEDIKVKFANNTNSSKLVKIEAGGYKLSWTVEAETENGEGINKVKLSKESKAALKTTEEINKQNREKIKKESKNNYAQVLSHKLTAESALERMDLANTAEPEKNEAVVRANQNTETYNREQIQSAASYAQSMVEYKDVFGEGMTLRYLLSPGKINEEVVLDSLNGFKSYSMLIDTDGLTPIVTETGRVDLTDEEGNVIMTIDPPYMYDSIDAISENISVTAEQESKKEWRIKYIPNQEWLTSQDRVYPVVIDPTVSTRNYPQTSVLDAFVYKNQTEYSNRNLPYLRVGHTTDNGMHISYWGVNNLPTLPAKSYITGAGLYIRFTDDNEDSENITIHSTTGTLNTAAMNWSSRPTVGSFLDNQASLPSGYWVNFCSASFGSLIRTACEKGLAVAFALKYADGSSKYQYNDFCSADHSNTSYRPYLLIKYTLTFADIAEGDYYIRNLNSGKCLSVRDSGTTAGTTVTQYSFSGTMSQVWTLSKTSGSDDEYNAYHLSPKNAPNLHLYYTKSTIKAQISNTSDADRSKWRFEEVSTGVYAISSVIQPWVALDVDNYSTEDGADVYVYAYHGNDNQLWVLERIGSDTPPPSSSLPEFSSDVPTGTYYIRNEYTNQNLQYFMSNDSVSVGIHSIDLTQMWNITNFGNGNYSIKPFSKANTYLEILYDIDAEGQPLSTIYNQIETYSNMRLMNSSGGTYKICPTLSTTNRVLTANDDGSVKIYTNDSNLSTQNWVLIPTNPSPATQYIAPGEKLEFSSLAVLENNAYNNDFFSTKVQWIANIVNIQIARIVDQTGKVEGVTPGEVFIQAKYENDVVLEYKLIVSGIENGIYYLRNKESTKYLDIGYGEMAEGTEVVQNNFTDIDHSQKWEIVRYDRDYYTIQSMNSGTAYYLGVSDDSVNPGASVVLRSGTITDGMKWKIIPNGRSYKLVPETGESDDYVLSSDGNDVHQLIYTQGEGDWYISPKRVFTLTVNNYFDEGYNVKFSKNNKGSMQHIMAVMDSVEEFYFEKFGLIIESTVQKFTSPLDTAKGSVTHETITQVCEYTDSAALLAALENGYWGNSTTTNIIWTGHNVESYSQLNRSHSHNEEGVIFMLDFSHTIQSDKEVIIHELAHQLGTPDHYHDDVTIPGECRNSNVCSYCGGENARPSECIMNDLNIYRYFCAICENEIVQHLESHH